MNSYSSGQTCIIQLATTSKELNVTGAQDEARPPRNAVKLTQVSRLPSERLSASKEETKESFTDRIGTGRQDTCATLFHQFFRNLHRVKRGTFE